MADVEAATAAIETSVRWILVGRAGQFTSKIRVVDAMGVSVIRQQREVMTKAMMDGKQQSLIARVRPVIGYLKSGKIRAIHRILQVEQAPLAGVGRAGAWFAAAHPGI